MNLQKPSVGDKELRAVKKIFQSGWLGLGSSVKEFEDRLSDYLQSKYVVAVSTGTAALHLALHALGITEGDEVILPSLTFVATAQAVVACGATPVFCDIEESTLNLDVDNVEKKITKKTKAIIPVHYRGMPCDMHKLKAIARKHRIPIVEDAAHAFGSKYNGKMIGTIGDITCFSFDPIKNITCGEGGAIVVRNKGLYKKLISMRTLGIDKDAWNRYKNKRSLDYDVKQLGFRYHMSNISAAIGLVQLQKVEKMNKRRNEIAKEYDSAFKNVSGLKIIKTNYDTTALFMYVLRVLNDRPGFIQFLSSKNVPTGIHYIPCHKFSFFRRSNFKLPITEKVYKEIVTLPLYVDMEKEDIARVISAVKEYFSRYGK